MNIPRPARPPAPGARIWALLAGLLTLVGILGFTTTTASATGLPAAQTRVGAFTSTAGVLVGPSAAVSPGQGRVQPVPQPGFVVATGVAAEGGSGLLNDAARAEQHLTRLDHSPANDAMIARIRSRLRMGGRCMKASPTSSVTS